jgi:hypothetical protein
MAKKGSAGQRTKADAVRATLAEGIVKPAEASAHMQKTYGLDVSPQTVSVYKTASKKKSGGVMTPRVASRARASANGNPADLARQVKALVQQYGAVAVSDMLAVFSD